MDAPRVVAGTAPAREPPFELVFRLNAQDYQACLRKLRWSAVERVVAALPAFGIGALGGLVGFLAIQALETVNPVAASWSRAAAVAGALILYALYRLLLMPRFYRSHFAGQPIALGETKVVADMRGIGMNVAEIVIATPWARVVRVVETDRHVFVMFARLAAVIVPKRAFASADQARRFAAFARSMTPSARR